MHLVYQFAQGKRSRAHHYGNRYTNARSKHRFCFGLGSKLARRLTDLFCDHRNRSLTLQQPPLERLHLPSALSIPSSPISTLSPRLVLHYSLRIACLETYTAMRCGESCMLMRGCMTLSWMRAIGMNSELLCFIGARRRFGRCWMRSGCASELN
jgi:hypothetical protein